MNVQPPARRARAPCHCQPWSSSARLFLIVNTHFLLFAFASFSDIGLMSGLNRWQFELYSSFNGGRA
jgi:hypothetical protein